MKSRRLVPFSNGNKGYTIVVLFVSALIVWQTSKLSDDFSGVSERTNEIKDATEPYLYHTPEKFPEGIKEQDPDYLVGHKEGWYTLARTSHHSPYGYEIPTPPYQLPERYFAEPDDSLSNYEKGFRDGYFLADNAIFRISFYSPKNLRKDMRKLFSAVVVRNTPDSVLQNLNELGYDFES